VTAPARLLSVRLQGFKSFAERTHVTFGPGISAVVGPNGSGKSNLADALRWALGEQGRALRSRKAEDVIWAGSERRAALGMADVQLVLDNADGLLPVEYGVVELGRRLYRSGENDYLLNRQRVRLRDLVDLLDGAHLAENAFLFIGQGMVDQALALRPEERRPLFEEVAGVRRHERRRRRAEEQLLESDANLARVDDILAELRPQARRLAAQAEQQVSRRSAGDELAAAILAAAHARWHAAASRLGASVRAVAEARSRLDTSMAALAEHESAVSGVAAMLDQRAGLEAARRRVLDAARVELNALRLREGRIESELAGVDRDRARLAAERAGVEGEVGAARLVLAEPAPARDLGLDGELTAAERALAEAIQELAAAARDAGADDADAAAIRRLEAARHADATAAQRRLADAERLAATELDRAAHSRSAADAAAASLAEARAELELATAAGAEARSAREGIQAELLQLEADARAASDRAAALRSELAGLRGRLDAAERALADADRGAFATAARAAGGRRFDRDVVVDPALRAAVDAALAGLGRAYVVDRSGIGRLASERGVALVAEAVAGNRREADSVDRRFAGAVAGRGGGVLADAVRRDDRGAVRRSLALVAWLPDLAACLALQDELPPGWTLVTRDGLASVGQLTVSLRPGGGTLELGAEAERLRAEVAHLAQTVERAETTAADEVAKTERGRQALESARDREAAATALWRRLEELERPLARATESTAREAAWLDAQAGRLRSEAERERLAMPVIPAPVAAPTGAPPGDAVRSVPDHAAVAPWEARVRDLRVRRDRMAALVAAADLDRSEGERRRARAEAAVTIGETRLASGDGAALALVERETTFQRERDELATGLAVAVTREREAHDVLDRLLGEDVADRERLGAAEQAAGRAREQLRLDQGQAQAAERDELEARLGLEGLREQVLVELAAIGEVGNLHLRELVGGARPGDAVRPGDAGEHDESDGDANELERLLSVAGAAWAANPPPPDPPTPGRLAALRRRYHELGAGNPFAVEEYATVRGRLEDLEAQRTDLQAAIDRTRTLIVELDALIASQFRATFALLERTFDARFRQLFGGGFARLSLTDPGDLAVTGVEIVARPPGKKPQALAMLSGGERALTAVALLFAMLEVRPVPFCVLDEVDAALDEANIGRFTDALRELAAQTQCIVITHNRGTIETADALYGVTVGEDSVSRVISLRLEEATELANRTRPSTTAVEAAISLEAGLGLGEASRG
jgi:chromosome segregation protein